MAQEISELPKSETAEMLEEMRRMADRMASEIERVMFGGYPPGYDRRTGMPGTLRFGAERCPHGCQVVCLHQTGA